MSMSSMARLGQRLSPALSRRSAALWMTCGLVCLASAAEAQTGKRLRWSTNVEQGIAAAKKSRLPLMFYIVGGSASRDEDGEDVERAQRRAFADPRVARLSERFVPVQLSRSRHADIIKQWEIPREADLWIVYTTPDGKKLDVSDAAGASSATGLADKMSIVFRRYRDSLFDTEAAATLEAKDASEEDLLAALELVKKFNILSADLRLVELAKREDLPDGVRQETYAALAQLSTPPAAKFLLERAATDPQAAAVLAKCNPIGAEAMLDAVGGEDPAMHLIAYDAVVKICKLKNPKADRFWEGRNERVKQEEIERVQKQVRETARKWRENEEPYR